MIRHPPRQMLQLLPEEFRGYILFILKKCLKSLANHRLFYISIVIIHLLKKLLRIRTVALPELRGILVKYLSHFICDSLLLLKLKSCLLVLRHCNPFLLSTYHLRKSCPCIFPYFAHILFAFLFASSL